MVSCSFPQQTNLLTQKSTRRVGHRGVYSNAVHPGVVASEPWAMAGDQEKLGDLIRKK